MPITYADVLTDQRVTEILNGEYLRLAADRENFLNHPALVYAGDFAGLGTLTRKIPYLGVDGYDLPEALAEGAQVTDSEILDRQVTITVGRFSRAHSATDVTRFTDSLGVFNAARFAQDAMVSHPLRLVDLIANLVDGFSANVTTSGVNLTAATYVSAFTLLEIGSLKPIGAGEAMCILHPTQLADLRDNLLSSAGGALQYNVPADRLTIKGVGYSGSFLGVDLFSSSRIPSANAGADRAGGMFLRGAVLWSDMSQTADSADSVVIGNKILFERERNARGATSSYISHSYLGATLGYDSASAPQHQLGVSIITDL